MDIIDIIKEALGKDVIIQEIIGKDVGAFYVSDGNITLFFTDGSDMRIRSGNYSWRIRKDDDIIMSSTDCFAHFVDNETAVFWPMQDEEESDNIDFYEYMEENFEKLESHIDIKVDKCKEFLEGSSIVSMEFEKSHDILVTFSNQIILEVFQMIHHDMNNPNECNIINLASDKREKETVIIL